MDAYEVNERINDLPCGVEYAKQKASCTKCQRTIGKGDLRMCTRPRKLLFDGNHSFHLDCFFNLFGVWKIEERYIRGLETLRWDDQERLRERLQHNVRGVDPRTDPEKDIKVEADDGPDGNHYARTCSQMAERPADSDSEEEVPMMKKFCFERLKQPEKKPEEDLRARLKKQTDAMCEIREKFLQNKMRRNDMIALLDHNGQMTEAIRSWTEDQLLEHLVDCVCFGKPIRCDRCDSGLLIFSLSLHSYACIGYASQFTRCINTQTNPPRSTFPIPSKTLEKYGFLNNVSFNVFSKRYYPADNDEIVKRRESNCFNNLDSRRAIEQIMEGVKEGVDERGHSIKIVKFGTTVDSEFEHANDCHVYRQDGALYSVLLHQTDVLINTNSYFKMQLLKHDSEESYYVFWSWGRVGTNVGGIKTLCYPNLNNAITVFSKMFFKKTGNAWVNRKYFKKKPGKFALVEEDYSQLEHVKESCVAPGSATKLHPSIKEIILMISDLDTIKKLAAKELHLDTTRMPLGKLSKPQITRAYSVLTGIQDILARDPTDMPAILDATNEFYTLVPHDFGMHNADILNNNDIIKKKCEMLDSLMNFQFAYDFLKQGEDESTFSNRDPVDIIYDKLRCKMKYLKKSSSDFQLIEQYLKSSHGETHASLSLEIVDIVELKRDGENEKFLWQMGNRNLLWHGSRLGNHVGILSQGLRIAPPEAPATGYMFGRGVYSADVVSKSAFYCRANTEGLLLLCDVALGDMQEELHDRNVDQPSDGFHSVKGVGRIRPFGNDHRHPEGFSISLNGVRDGDANAADNDYSLIYNEYIVYNVDQIRLRYLVRCRFNTT